MSHNYVAGANFLQQLAEAGLTDRHLTLLDEAPILLEEVTGLIIDTIEAYVDEIQSIRAQQHSAQMRDITVLQLSAPIINRLRAMGATRIHHLGTTKFRQTASAYFSEEELQYISTALATYNRQP